MSEKKPHPNPFTLPSSKVTVSLRDPKSLTERVRRPVVDALIAMAGQDGPEAARLSHAFDDLLVVTIVESWSNPVPLTADALLDLAGEDYDAIRVAARSTMDVLMPNYSEVTPDPESPTPPLAA